MASRIFTFDLCFEWNLISFRTLQMVYTITVKAVHLNWWQIESFDQWWASQAILQSQKSLLLNTPHMFCTFYQFLWINVQPKNRWSILSSTVAQKTQVVDSTFKPHFLNLPASCCQSVHCCHFFFFFVSTQTWN